MFGYVTINKQELRFREYELYRSFYCGFCRELRERYGIPGQISLTYDMTFVILLLSALYEPPTSRGKTRCFVQPVRSHPVRKNRFTEYAADMNVILTYYKCQDDWKDEKKVSRLAYSKLLSDSVGRLKWAYAEKIERITACLDELSEQEQAGSRDLDLVSGIFGKLMGEILVYREDNWAPALRRLGFYLGKFVYLMDAYEDLEKDSKTGNYNPFLEEGRMKMAAYADPKADNASHACSGKPGGMKSSACADPRADNASHACSGKPDRMKPAMDAEFETRVKDILTMMMSRVCYEFEKLPVIAYGDILRNILYSGVWVRFEHVSRKRKTEGEKKHV